MLQHFLLVTIVKVVKQEIKAESKSCFTPILHNLKMSSGILNFKSVSMCTKCC